MKSALTLLFFSFVCLANAQDTIVRVDSSRVLAKVLTITDKTISYKRHNSPDGPTYEVARRHVARIAYADGTNERYGKTANEEYLNRKKNIVSITTTDIISGVITFNYERKFSNRFGVRVIGSMGVLGTTGKAPNYYTYSYYYSRYKLFSTGIDMHYYAYHGRNLSYYVGALVEYGRVRRSPYYWDFPPYPGHTEVQDYYFGGLTNGVSFQVSEHVKLDMFATLGWRHMLTPGSYSDYGARLGFSVGYAF